MTNDLPRRVTEHKNKVLKGFTSKYKISRLVYYEPTSDVAVEITPEKQIRGWKTIKKVQLINSLNPDWRDLSQDFMDIVKIA